MTRFYQLITTLYLCLFLQQATAATATIATASNFKVAMNALIAAFEAQQPHQLRQINASSGVLFNQITHGAPFDVLLAADRRYPLELEKRGLGITASRFTYAEGKLVLVASQAFSNTLASHKTPATTATDKPLTFQQALTAALSNNSKIAIANPTTAPYGMAAQQTLEQLKLWQQHPLQWVKGANIAQSLQYVVTGNASLGFVARAQLQSLELDYWSIPEHYYQPIRQQAILLQFGQHNPAATAFLDFLKSSEAKAIIRHQGYWLESD